MRGSSKSAGVSLPRSRSNFAMSAFARAVALLRSQRKTVTVVESSCDGLISSGIMTVPGSSAVYYGGTVSYNTKKARKLLLDDGEMHAALVAGVEPLEGESEADQYIRSKHDWTARTAVAFCEAMETDYAVAEGGAVGPTFRKEGLTSGFAVLCVAGRSAPGESVRVLAQKLVRSDHAHRERNMKAFAEQAAELLCETVSALEAAAVGVAVPPAAPPHVMKAPVIIDPCGEVPTVFFLPMGRERDEFYDLACDELGSERVSKQCMSRDCDTAQGALAELTDLDL